MRIPCAFCLRSKRQKSEQVQMQTIIIRLRIRKGEMAEQDYLVR